jgi:hypothetical protein
MLPAWAWDIASTCCRESASANAGDKYGKFMIGKTLAAI